MTLQTFNELDFDNLTEAQDEEITYFILDSIFDSEKFEHTFTTNTYAAYVTIMSNLSLLIEEGAAVSVTFCKRCKEWSILVNTENHEFPEEADDETLQ